MPRPKSKLILSKDGKEFCRLLNKSFKELDKSIIESSKEEEIIDEKLKEMENAKTKSNISS